MIIRAVFLDCRERCGPTGAPSFGMDVTIEDNVWIGGNVTILGGVTIGHGCAIGAGSLVTKDIPAYSLAYGSPARVIRRIDGPAGEFDPNVMSALAWGVPDRFHPTVYAPVRIGRHEFVVLELAAVLLCLSCALLLLSRV